MLERLRSILQDRYRVERQIGAGGMATVYLATDLKHGRDVAIKVLLPELAVAVGPDRFLREIEIAAKLQHPHIVPVYDSGQANGLLYYVMPFVAGESLRERLVGTGPLPPGDAVRIAREVADALAYAHAQGIVHRDIKPANILLSQKHALVADFGIARAVTASTSGQGLTQAGMAVGTPSYMSPEQGLGDAVDGRTDVYALGVVLYEMLAGRPPFEGSTPQAVLGQVLSRPAPKLKSDPLGVQSLIDRAMAKEPGQRFPTADELVSALDGLGGPTGLRAAAPRRRRALLAAGVALGAVLMVALLWPRRYRALGDPRKSLIVFPFENKTGDATRDYLSDASMNLLGLAAAHWQDMRVYDDERTASLMRRQNVRGDLDFEAARAMAREARVGTLVVGDLRREGDSLAVEAKVHDVGSGDRLETVVLRASWTADPRPLFDAIAARILGTSGAPPGERPSVLAQTTKSLAAYRAYLEGTTALQRFQIDSALTHLKQAVAIDSTFALAYVRLRDADGWSGPLGSVERRRQYIIAAERHSASLPQRLKALVEYHRAYGDNDYQRARRIAHEMIRRDSTDVEAWYQLGEAHYHHRAMDFPHDDTLGNLGLALRAFRHTLVLDSSYVLAYQHILDALSACAGSNFRVCFDDTAYYGAPADLEQRFGRATIDRQRAEARSAQIAAARGWVAAVPGTPRARQVLITALYNQQRYAEALQEVSAMEGLGWPTEAALLKGLILLKLGRAGDAATAVDTALRQAADTTAAFFSGLQSWSTPVVLLAGGGRWAAALRINAKLFEFLQLDSVNGPGNLWMARSDLMRLSRSYVAIELGQRGRPDEPDSIVADFRATLVRYARGDSVQRRRAIQSLGGSFLAAFLVTRDTALLVDIVRSVDTLTSHTWRVADAQLALARGDTARARLRVERHYRAPQSGEFNGEQGFMRAFGWGDLLARLGQPRDALTAYARLDSLEQRDVHPGFLVRSWAERGALHQQLGETADAVKQYDRFVAAWRQADPELQPLVERARAAAAALQGAPRREPGDRP
jgi:tetratricopeptide (TPR) repeat protein/TolB-like protein